MKRIGILMIALMLMSIFGYSQKAEVLYFKAELACCQARACDAIENDVKEVVEKNFNGETVIFKEIKLADAANKEIIEKHKAKSQTVVIVSKKNKNETVVDISPLIRKYSRSQNKAEFESELIAKINETIK